MSRYTMRFYDHHGKVVQSIKSEERGAAMISADYYMTASAAGYAYTYIQRCALYFRSAVVARKHVNGAWIERRGNGWEVKV